MKRNHNCIISYHGLGLSSVITVRCVPKSIIPEATTLRCQTRKQYPPSRAVSRIQQYKEKELGKPQKTKDETRPAKWLAQKTATARPVQTYTWPGL